MKNVDDISFIETVIILAIIGMGAALVYALQKCCPL